MCKEQALIALYLNCFQGWIIPIQPPAPSNLQKKEQTCHSEGRGCPRDLLFSDSWKKADPSVAAAISG